MRKEETGLGLFIGDEVLVGRRRRLTNGWELNES